MSLSSTSMVPPLRVAVIGTGKISEQHLQFLAATRHAQLQAVCDLSPAMARFAARRFRAPRHYTCPKQMLEAEKPDMVHVLTPPSTHANLVTQCLHAGTHVMVEKPLAPTLLEVQALQQLASTQMRHLIEDHNYRFNDSILQLRAAAAAGQLGNIEDVDIRLALNLHQPGNRYADAHLPHPSHQLPAGVVHEFLPHLCYLALCFISRWDRVHAIWSNHGPSTVFRYDDLDALVLAGSTHVRLRFTSRCWPESFTIAVHGSAGSLQTDLFAPSHFVTRPRRGPAPLTSVINQAGLGLSLIAASGANLRDKLLNHSTYHGLHTLLERTYSALRLQEPPPISPEDIRQTAALAEALIAEGQRP